MSELIDWQDPPARPRLEGAAIHLWRIRTDARGMALASAVAVLDQRARADDPRQGPHQARSIRAQAGLRLILGRYLERDPAALRFVRGTTGKPALPPDWGELRFNLTTSGDLALVAVATGHGAAAEIGIDCEYLRPRTDLERIAARMFAPAVADAIRRAPPAQRLDRFYQAWTALEADVKTDGRGLFRARPPMARAPMIQHFIPERGYIGAVARTWLPPLAGWSTFAAPSGWMR
ncbi:MAG: 4'-phosphopantetheinyl transferase superfamily protein [Sphingobacteriia bacterium]|nr:4'-phosphopantetheinyl transferase superfamily protein [Sphingobacteriia bacterium]NCC39699.1 4'-phosphopantetheinyl transferase superfamily protein [Gammaproteobacteria bacterium]